VNADDRSPLAGTEVHLLPSDHVGEVFKIFVGHCGTVAPAGPPPPVLYVTDANGLFGSAVDIVRFLQLSDHLPPLVVVGIGYPMGALEETVIVRTRDLTPTVDPGFVRIFPGQTLMGGADRFLAFIVDELQPWVQGRYRVDADDSAYFGHSQGGLFGTWVLLTRPSTFRRYGIGSPSLWWDDDMMFGYEAAYAAAHRDLPAKVFFSVGAFEDFDGRQREVVRLSPDERAAAAIRPIDMVADTERMVAALHSRGHPSLELDSAVLAGEFHVTVPQLNLSRSLRFLFDAPT